MGGLDDASLCGQHAPRDSTPRYLGTYLQWHAWYRHLDEDAAENPILYEQMVGRGMRGPEFGGTERCLVIDVDDNIQWRNQPVTVEYAWLEQEMRYAD